MGCPAGYRWEVILDASRFNVGSVPPPPSIRIVAVNRNRIFRDGLSVLIDMQPDLTLLASVASPYEAVRLFAEMRPDLTLMDLDQPSNMGLEAIQQIRILDPEAWVIGLLTNDWDDIGTQALNAGADSILTKDSISQRLMPVIRAGREARLASAAPPVLGVRSSSEST